VVLLDVHFSGGGRRSLSSAYGLNDNKTSMGFATSAFLA
jgi:hypothetical protein